MHQVTREKSFIYHLVIHLSTKSSSANPCSPRAPFAALLPSVTPGTTSKWTCWAVWRKLLGGTCWVSMSISFWASSSLFCLPVPAFGNNRTWSIWMHMSHEHFQFLPFLPFLPFCTSLLCIFSSLHSDGVQWIFTGHPEAFQASKLLLELGPEQFAGSTDAGPEKMSTKKTKKKKTWHTAWCRLSWCHTSQSPRQSAMFYACIGHQDIDEMRLSPPASTPSVVPTLKQATCRFQGNSDVIERNSTACASNMHTSNTLTCISKEVNSKQIFPPKSLQFFQSLQSSFHSTFYNLQISPP